MIVQARHTGLVVRDLEKSIAFYEAIGLEVSSRAEETGKFIDTLTGIDNVVLEWAKLSTKDNFLIELLQYKSHGLVEVKENAISNKLGCSHVAYTVENIDEFCEKIINLGGTIVNPPVASPDGNVRVCYAHDLDGIILEIVEVL